MQICVFENRKVYNGLTPYPRFAEYGTQRSQWKHYTEIFWQIQAAFQFYTFSVGNGYPGNIGGPGAVISGGGSAAPWSRWVYSHAMAGDMERAANYTGAALKALIKVKK